MSRPARSAICGILLLLLSTGAAVAVPRRDATAGRLPAFGEKTKGLVKRAGLLDLWVDRDRGQVWLELPAPSGSRGEIDSFLYVEGIVTGLGSNPIGLDRGQLGETRVVTLRRLGEHVLVEAQNLGYRALSNDEEEIRAVRESFAGAVLWAGSIGALDPDGRALVDFTSFVVRDAHEVVRALRAAGQGAYAFAPERSAVDLAACLAFPENLEFEALLTWTAAQDPGLLVAATAPNGSAFSLVQHHSLVKLPEPGYAPRAFDPRAGSYGISFVDYAAPLDAPTATRWIARHRLEKVDPTAERSPVVKPIVYYLDPATPEPVRSAVLDGARWWARAFEAAGFVDAYRVEMLPAGVHPLDVRYNVIQWIHRSTRGWSYGGGVIDPRTGEIVKGQVSLGSLRVRQDRRIFEGLAGTSRTGSGAVDDPVVLALARIRQLAAHEVGHTLGFAHNFAASTYGGRASVMDYPAPRVAVTGDGALDFSQAYGVGVGEWDRHAIRYAYTRFAPRQDEPAGLAAIVEEGNARGLTFLTDRDARPPGAAEPLASLWDNGADPVEALREVLAVRRAALERFGEGNVRRGTALAELEEVLAPVYFYHRYQVEATAKAVGGVSYRYALRGDSLPRARAVPAEVQRAALAELLKTIDPTALDLADSVLRLLLPTPYEEETGLERFGSATAPVFDALGAAATAAELTLQALLQPERAARLVDQHRREPGLPGLEELLDRIVAASFPASAAVSPRLAEIRRAVQAATVRVLVRLASDARAPATVRARVEDVLERLASHLQHDSGEEAVHARFFAGEIRRFLDRDREDNAPPPPIADPPPGSPIGAADWLGRGCEGG